MTDLIGRQAAIDALMAWEEGSFWDDECLKHRGEPYWVAPSDVIERLPSAQPTVDAVPVRHGKWTVTPIYIKCSECGESFMLIPQNYCPNCGARMDKDV